jgi:hypothetical protein
LPGLVPGIHGATLELPNGYQNFGISKGIRFITVMVWMPLASAVHTITVILNPYLTRTGAGYLMHQHKFGAPRPQAAEAKALCPGES